MHQKGIYCENKSHEKLFITTICIRSFLAIHLIYHDVFTTPKFRIIYLGALLPISSLLHPDKAPEKPALYVLGLLIQQSFLRSTQMENIPIRHETLHYSNVCTRLCSRRLPPLLPPPHTPHLSPPPPPPPPPGRNPEPQEPPAPAAVPCLPRLQEICFTRLVLTELPAVRHIAAVCEMNDGKGKSVISFVQTDYSHVAHGIICLSLND